MDWKTGLSQWRNFQVLIKVLSTDAEPARKRGFWLAGTSAAAQFDNLVIRKRFLATSVGAALFRQCDPFALPLADQGPLELRECPHD